MYAYEFNTNDPKKPVIKVTLHAAISAVPDYARKLEGANIADGERVSTFKVWPTAHPTIKLQRGESFTFSLKVTVGEYDTRLLAQAPQSEAGRVQSNGGGNNAVANGNGTNGGYQTLPAEPIPLPEDKVSYDIRREGTLHNYWIDFHVAGIDSPGRYQRSVVLPSGSDLAGLKIELRVTVLARNLVVVPDSLPNAEVSLQALKNGEVEIGVVGLRKESGEFHIKALTSTLPFIRAVPQPIFANKNYLIHIRASSTPALRPGVYDGKLIIETDDKYAPRAEVPVKVTLVP